MGKIRVLLANHPVMVPDAIRRLLEEQDDIELVGDCRGPMKILQETGRVKVDVVIFTQQGPEEPSLCSQLLSVYPDLTIVSVSSDMASASMQQLRSHRTTVIATDQEDIVRALCKAVRAPCSRQDAGSSWEGG